MKKLLFLPLILISSLAHAHPLDEPLLKLAQMKDLVPASGTCKQDGVGYENQPPLGYVLSSKIKLTSYGNRRRYLIDHGLGKAVNSKTIVFHVAFSPLERPQDHLGAFDIMIIKFSKNGTVVITTNRSYVDINYDRVEPPTICNFVYKAFVKSSG